MLLIDGYNLLHVTRFQPQGRGPGGLRRSREELLAFLAEYLDSVRYPRVTIVFDAHQAPRRLPSELKWRHLQVYFARDHASADEMIESLIRKDPAPRKLTVVSSDHRIQWAAKRRKATYVDSDTWFDALLESPRPDDPPSSLESRSGTEKERAEARLADEDWSAFFAAALREQDEALRRDPREADAPNRRAPEESNHENPFPPGYLEEITDEFSDEL